MEKQIQINQNKATNSATENDSQQQSQTTHSPPSMPSLWNYEYFKEMKTHLH